MWAPSFDQITSREQREAEATAAAWAALREKRDRLIAASDWIILRNLETDEPVPQGWLDYRQALRDMPETTTDPASPNWPDIPST